MILVTGASGFVGHALVATLAARGMSVRAVSRTRPMDLPEGVVWVSGPELDADADWSQALQGVSCVVHCAARVHVMKETSGDTLGAYRMANVVGTMQLARQAVELGCTRFVFVSSIKVNGEETLPGAAFKASDMPRPVDPYGISKWEAEQGLAILAQRTGLQTVVVRPPLVYGPGVRANFLAMMRWVKRGIPLPLGSVTENRRSLVALDNLVDLLATCIVHPAAAGQSFLVSDGHDVSTSELLSQMAAALGTRARQLPVPPGLLLVIARLVGREPVAHRLLGNLQVDISPTCRTLGWTPPVALAEGLRRAAFNLGS
ncbi:UDP-glucose 4-epimerase family protein [Herbaspirillum chlorophenolicum]|uniref:UDP-glucose 4-epimerase family protein n=1 Tax=Herbaspirillum chlorophenolicum TaxID=211589 RepID=A0ABW8ESF3_9BURK